jgi:hypothetical protein
MFGFVNRNESPRSAVSVRKRLDAAQAVVAVLTEDIPIDSASSADLARWKRLNPSAEWLSVKLPSGPMKPECGNRRLQETVRRLRVRSDRLVIVGTGKLGRCALDLVLQGALPCAGILAIDAAWAPLPNTIAATAAAIRLVAHEDKCKGRDGDAMLALLQAADIDERIMMLASSGIDDHVATARAAETFLLELIAIASRQRDGKVRKIHD